MVPGNGPLGAVDGRVPAALQAPCGQGRQGQTRRERLAPQQPRVRHQRAAPRLHVQQHVHFCLRGRLQFRMCTRTALLRPRSATRHTLMCVFRLFPPAVRGASCR